MKRCPRVTVHRQEVSGSGQSENSNKFTFWGSYSILDNREIMAVSREKMKLSLLFAQHVNSNKLSDQKKDKVDFTMKKYDYVLV